MIVLDEAKTIAIWYVELNEETDFLGCLQHPDDPEKDVEVYETVNTGDWNKFLDEFRAQPFAHEKVEKAAEA